MLAVLLTPLGRADAASSVLCTGYASCGSAGYSDGGYQAKQGSSYWAMYTGTNCTNSVAYRLVATNKMPNRRPASGVGNARDWGTTMASITNSTPTAGSVAWWGRPSGGNHVAYVERVVSSNEIWVSESNWSGAFDWRKITRGGSGWPDGFIHFADPAPQVLAPSTAPELSGIPTTGVAVSVSTGTWSPAGSGTTYTYQWSLDGAPIAGATAATFTPTDSMLGRALSVAVTARRSGYAPRTSIAPPADVWPVELLRRDAPTISGTARVGATLTASAGDWYPRPDDTRYQWTVDGVAVAGATSSTFVPAAAHRGKQVRVQVTADHPDYDPSVATSAPTAPVVP
jgi:surface antigen